MIPLRQLWLGLLVCFLACTKGRETRRPLRVAAAADLMSTLTELAPLYGRTTGEQVVFSFGSSGLLARQIAEGAPFDLFCAASADYVDGLLEKGRIAPGTRAEYARGRLCLAGRAGGPILSTVAQLSRRDIGRIAIANPEHAPYGRAAMAALRGAGIYEQVKDRLVFGENVRQALQYVESGNVDAALVACSLLTGQKVEVPGSQHPPIEQVLGVVRGGDERGARRFAELMRSAEGQAVLRRHGFDREGPKAPRIIDHPGGER